MIMHFGGVHIKSHIEIIAAWVGRDLKLNLSTGPALWEKTRETQLERKSIHHEGFVLA